MNIANDRIRTSDLWSPKQPLYQLRHNLCSSIAIVILVEARRHQFVNQPLDVTFGAHKTPLLALKRHLAIKEAIFDKNMVVDICF